MAGFTESNITLDFPKDSWFRFQQSKPYSDISGFGFKEMDACYVDELEVGNRVFYAIELKDYSAADSLTEDNMTNRIWDIVKKNVDTIQMFMSAKYQNGFGLGLEAQKGIDLHSSIGMARFVTVVNIKPENVQMLQAMKDKCLDKLRAYSCVWDNISITLMTKEQAQKRFEFVK